MKLTPREYQLKSAEVIVENLKNKGKGIAVLPTGAGKTLVMSLVAEMLNEDILIIAHNSGLVSQNYQAAVDLGIENCEVFCNDLKQKNIGKVTFCTVKSAKNAVEKFKHFNFVLIDECDLSFPCIKKKKEGTKTIEILGEYHQFFRDIGIKTYCGLTATPLITKNYSEGPMIKVITRQRPRNFNNIIYHCPVSKMVESGYWSKLEYINYKFDEKDLKKNSTGRDFTDVSIKKALEKQSINNNAYILINRLMKEIGKPILLFCHSLKDAEIFKKHINGSEIISYKTKGKDRERIMNDFRAEKIPVLINLNCLKQGANFPKLEYIIMLRPYGSIRDYIQVVGRGVRKAEGKESCKIIDFAGNIDRFGKVEDIDIKLDYTGEDYQLFSGERQLSGIYGESKVDRKYENVLFEHGGKFKGKPLKAVPEKYLNWCISNLDNPQKEIFLYLKKS